VLAYDAGFSNATGHVDLWTGDSCHRDCPDPDVALAYGISLEAGETAWISDDVLGEVDMNISGLLETIIALAALFWLVTTACSFLLEAFHAMSNLRGNALRSFVVEMVGFDKTGSGPSIGKQVMDHPLIVAIQTDRRIY
jgi:hypothetical protein